MIVKTALPDNQKDLKKRFHYRTLIAYDIIKEIFKREFCRTILTTPKKTCTVQMLQKMTWEMNDFDHVLFNSVLHFEVTFQFQVRLKNCSKNK